MLPYPLVFHPLLKPKVWGGRTLERFGRPIPPGTMVGESWEVADLPLSIPQGRSVIANGALAGQTLRQAVQAQAPWLMGDAQPGDDGGFPLLIKYLDARENLSVQVHPSPAYAARHPEAHLKSEAWVVLAADEGAVIYKGLRAGVTRELFAQHLRMGQIVQDLAVFEARPGDCHYLPSGTCHALGAGILVAEVQTPSDTTFRVYDWGRTGPGRDLHIEQALECIDFSGRSLEPLLSEPMTHDGVTSRILARTDFFEIERVEVDGSCSFEVRTNGLPQVWLIIEGQGQVLAEGIAARGGSGTSLLPLQPGVTTLIPAAARGWRASFGSSAWLLIVRLPSPLRRMLA